MSRAAHLKKPRRGFFARRTIRRADVVRIHPPSESGFAAKKTDIRRFRTKPAALPHPAFDGRKKPLKKKVKNS